MRWPIFGFGLVVGGSLPAASLAPVAVGTDCGLRGGPSSRLEAEKRVFKVVPWPNLGEVSQLRSSTQLRPQGCLWSLTTAKPNLTGCVLSPMGVGRRVMKRAIQLTPDRVSMCSSEFYSNKFRQLINQGKNACGTPQVSARDKISIGFLGWSRR